MKQSTLFTSTNDDLLKFPVFVFIAIPSRQNVYIGERSKQAPAEEKEQNHTEQNIRRIKE
jgi:hypothetical protein